LGKLFRPRSLSIQGIKQPPYEVEIFHKDGSVYTLEVSKYIERFFTRSSLALAAGDAGLCRQSQPTLQLHIHNIVGRLKLCFSGSGKSTSYFNCIALGL
jgi:hypothetical protein